MNAYTQDRLVAINRDSTRALDILSLALAHGPRSKPTIKQLNDLVDILENIRFTTVLAAETAA